MEKDLKAMRVLFNGSQHLHKHQKCQKELTTLFEHYKSSQQLEAFREELMRNIAFALRGESKSPFTKHTIDFIAKFLLSICSDQSKGKSDETVTEETANEEMASEGNDENDENVPPFANSSAFDDVGVEAFGELSFNTTVESSKVAEEVTLTDMVLKSIILKQMYAINNDCRYNACVFVRKVFTELKDIDSDVYDRMRKALLDRCADKERNIRCAAALALHRFQEDYKDLVFSALQFHLKYDPDSQVRQACLQSLAPTKETINGFISATRDVNDMVRKTAFTLIADKVNIRLFSIEQRLTVLRNGLYERSAAVRKTVETKLIPNWVKKMDGDIVKLLHSLDIQSDPNLIEKMLNLYFKHAVSVVNDSGLTGFHKIMEDFKEKYLDQKLVRDLTSENAFLWRLIAKYALDNNIVITRIEASPEMAVDDEASNDCGEKEIEIPAVDSLVPDLPYYCTYIDKFVEIVMNSVNAIEEERVDATQLLDFEFIFKQLLLIGRMVEVGDEPQRQILERTLIEILRNEKLFVIFTEYVPLIIKLFQMHIYTDSDKLLAFTVKIIDMIFMHHIENVVEDVATNTDTNADMVETDYTEQMRRIEMEYARLTVNINELRDELDAATSNQNFLEAQRIKENIDELSLRRTELKEQRLGMNCCPDSQSTRQTQTQTESQSQMTRTFSDFPEALELCTSIFCACLEFGDFKLVNSVILANVEKLVLPSVTTMKLSTRSIGIKCLGLCCMSSIELSRKYLSIFIEFVKYDNEERPKENALKNIFDVLCVYGLTAFEDYSANFEKFNDIFSDFLLELIDTYSDDVKLIIAKGIAKLFLLDHLNSRELLTRLIIIWIDNNSNARIRQFLSAFFMAYSQRKETLYVEVFTDCIEATYEKRLNTDMLINAFLSLISDDGQRKLAPLVSNRILSIKQVDELTLKYLKVLTLLRISEMSRQDIDIFQVLLRKVENLFTVNRSPKKSIAMKIQSIQLKINKQKDVLSNSSEDRDNDSTIIYNETSP